MIGTCTFCNKEFSYYPSRSSGRYCSKKCTFLCPLWREKQSEKKKGKKMSLKSRLKMSKSRKGIKHTKEHVEKRMQSFKATKKKKREEKLKNITGTMADYPLYKQVRFSPHYRSWRISVLERDGYKCTLCGSTSNLEVNHVIPFASLFHEAQILNDVTGMFNIENGQTTCKSCHVKTPTYCQKKNKQVEYQLMEAIEQEWKQEGSKGDFESFYSERMGKLTDMIKAKLDNM